MGISLFKVKLSGARNPTPSNLYGHRNANKQLLIVHLIHTRVYRYRADDQSHVFTTLLLALPVYFVKDIFFFSKWNVQKKRSLLSSY